MTNREPCKLCEKGYSCFGDMKDDKKVVAEIFPDDQNILISFVYDEAGKEKRTQVSLTMNYCPLCGKSLKFGGPITTCKDCANTTRWEEDGEIIAVCDRFGERMDPDFFCAAGFRDKEVDA